MALSAKRSHIVASLIGLLLTVLVLGLQFREIPVLAGLYQRLELLVYDQRMRLHTARKVVDNRVVIVDIDETSLREEGRWPWSRKRIADLVNNLAQAGAVVVAFDVLFAEPERNPVDEILSTVNDNELSATLKEQLLAVSPRLDADKRLADAMGSTDVILGYTFNPAENAVSGQLPEPLPLLNPEVIPHLSLVPMRGYSAPLSLLQQSARGGGFFSLIPDADGVVRRAPLLIRYDGKLYGSLALEAIRHYLFLEGVRLETATISGEEQIERIHLDATNAIPTDGAGRVLIPYKGRAGAFPYISAHDVLSGNIEPNNLMGAIVLIGTTASGLFDLRATPFSHIYPGVEVHANLITAMLDNRYLVQPSWADGANFLLTAVLGLLLTYVMPRMHLGWLLMLTCSAVGMLIMVTSWFWLQRGLVLELTAPLLVILLLTAFNLAWGYFFETLKRHRLKGMFGQYIPPELVNQMSDHPEEYGIAGENRELSVLFSDIRGFTTISESLEAGELKGFLNHFFTPMTKIIFDNHGTIDKYVGDMVMAFWGAPVSDSEHAVHAIESALEMLAQTESLKSDFAARGWPEVEIGIGINTGMMSVGDMGSEYRRAYTVLGDAVNLASRLESATKYYGVGLIVGERTRELVGDIYLYRELDQVRVKGKSQAVRIFQPVCRRELAAEALINEIETLERAILAYRQRDWTQAMTLFEQLQRIRPEFHLYSLYIERIGELSVHELDESWDGVFVRSEK